MFSKVENGKIEALKRKQTDLTQQINVLQNETRRLREEITNIEVTKREVNSNKTSIETTIREIEQLQKCIRDEVNKISRKTKEIEDVASNLSNDPGTPNNTGLNFPPPPPPPPLMVTMNRPLQKSNSFKTPSPKEQITIGAEIPTDLLVNIKKGVKLSKVDESTIKDITIEEEIARYMSSISKKEEEIDRLTGVVGELASKLKTETESQNQYQVALEKQKIFLSQLTQNKKTIKEKLDIIKARVATELTSINEIVNPKKDAANVFETSSKVIDLPPQNAIGKNPPPPPPPPPLLKAGVERLSSPLIKRDLQQRQKKQDIEGPATTAQNNGPNLESVKQKAKEFEERKETRALRDYLTNKLINVLIKVATDEMDSSDLDEIEFKDNELKIIQLINGSGVDELLDSITRIIKEFNKSASLNNAIFNRRAAIEGGNSGLAIKIDKYRNKPEIIEAVSCFIDTKQNQGIQLLEMVKEMKQHEEEEARRIEEEESRKQAILAKERSKQLEEERRLAEEMKALAIQEKLKEMGVPEGVVDLEKVRKAESEKIQILEVVSIKESNLQKMNEFISGVDNELERTINALHKAEAHRALSLETIEKRNGIEQETVEKGFKSTINDKIEPMEDYNSIDKNSLPGERSDELSELKTEKVNLQDEMSDTELSSNGLIALKKQFFQAYYNSKTLAKKHLLIWDDKFNDVLLKNLFNPDQILHAVNQEQLISIENSPVSNLTYHELEQAIKAIDEGNNDYYSLTSGEDISYDLLCKVGLSESEILTMKPTMKLFYQISIVNAMRIAMGYDKDKKSSEFRQIYKDYLSGHLEQENDAKYKMSVSLKDLLNNVAPIIRAHHRFVTADQLLQSSLQMYQSNSPIIQYAYKVRQEIYKLARKVRNTDEIDMLADIEETCAKAISNPNVETIQACIDKGNVLTKNSLTKSLGGLLISFAGAAIFSVSLAVAVESFGIAAPLSAIGMAFGESLIVGSLATSSAALGAGGSAYGSYMFFNQPNKDLISEELYGIANSLVAA